MAFGGKVRHLAASAYPKIHPMFRPTTCALRSFSQPSKVTCLPFVISRSLSSSNPVFGPPGRPSRSMTPRARLEQLDILDALLTAAPEYGYDLELDEAKDRLIDQLTNGDPTPEPQDYWHFTAEGTWQPTSSLQTPTSAEHGLNPKAIRLISWNIDALKGFAEVRMDGALRYLENLVGSAPVDCANVVFLQEMVSSDLQQISQADWIKKGFNITEMDDENWLGSFFGTTALVDRRLTINQSFRVPWVGEMGRDGLFVDIALTNAQSSSDKGKVLRLCNTHLESLAAHPPIRPSQLAAASAILKETNVASALLAGDLNAIQPFDRTLHTENGLKDAYLELGGGEDSHDGFTWGYQVPKWKRDKFGCCRMDKILLRGDIQPKSFERIGVDVKVAEAVLPQVQRALKGPWVTDHYGVMGDFEFTEGWQLQT